MFELGRRVAWCTKVILLILSMYRNYGRQVPAGPTNLAVFGTTASTSGAWKISRICRLTPQDVAVQCRSGESPIAHLERNSDVHSFLWDNRQGHVILAVPEIDMILTLEFLGGPTSQP